jgi:protein TonB
MDPPTVPREAEPPAPPKAKPVHRPPAKAKRTPVPPKKEVVLAEEARPVSLEAEGPPSPTSEAIRDVASQPAETQALAFSSPTTGEPMARGGAAGTGAFVGSLDLGSEGSAGIVVKEAIPRYEVNPDPPYPETARRRGLEGTVLLSVLVRSNGTVGEVKLAKTSGHRLLDAAAMGTIRDWQFIPGRRGERPVQMEIRVPVRFQLE